MNNSTHLIAKLFTQEKNLLLAFRHRNLPRVRRALPRMVELVRSNRDLLDLKHTLLRG